MSNRLIFALTLAIAGCSSGPDGADASAPRDAALADGGGLLDGGADAAGFADGGGDAGGVVACAGACDPRMPGQCGDGESCVLAGESSSCEAMWTGSIGPEGPCMYATDCAPGLACFETPDGGRCGRVCCPGDSTCIDGASCGGSGVLIDGTATPWGRCLPPRSCDVLAPEDSCEMREGCYIVDSAGNTECRFAGGGEAGAPCATQEDCRSGFFCGGIAETRCVRICRIDGEPCPIDEGRCMAQAHSPEGTGFCTIDSTTARP